MYILIIKKDIRTKGFQHFILFTSAQEKSFIDSYIPE